jgi:diguanylate cyclase (GGDEF)-like protein
LSSWRDPSRLSGVYVINLLLFRKRRCRNTDRFEEHILQRHENNLKTNVRKGTVVARFGGEEFAVIFLHVALHTAHLAMENIRRLIESNIATEDGKISAGVSEANLSDPGGLNCTQQDLIRRADENLYRAKRSGRNRVCSLPTPPE